jgi:hypothetical protein
MIQNAIDLPVVLHACSPKLGAPRLRARRNSLAPTILVFGLALFLVAQIFLGA